MGKGRPFLVLMMPVLLCFMVLAGTCFEGCVSAAASKKEAAGDKRKSVLPNGKTGSTVVFPLGGSVYPVGYYYVNLKIGNPAKEFKLDIDTGSDLTWVQCKLPSHAQGEVYKPKQILPCSNDLCSAVESIRKFPCAQPSERCEYEIAYYDGGSSKGVLVQDYLPLKLLNRSFANARFSFGCGYEVKNNGQVELPPTVGVLGLGKGKVSVVSQLQSQGLAQNVVGHCLGGGMKGGGFVFIGQDLVPPAKFTWMPMSEITGHYSPGPAELVFNGKPTGIKGQELIFDSGSSYTYFNSQLYKSTIDLIRTDLNGKLKDAPEEKALPVCWKGKKSFKSLQEVRNYFKFLALSFTNARNVQLQIPPENYLIVTKGGNVCLGILEMSGQNTASIIGDIFLQDMLVIYDNVKQQIGWAPTPCNRSIKDDYNEDFCQPYAVNFGLGDEQCPLRSDLLTTRQVLTAK